MTSIPALREKLNLCIVKGIEGDGAGVAFTDLDHEPTDALLLAFAEEVRREERERILPFVRQAVDVCAQFGVPIEDTLRSLWNAKETK